MATQTSEDRPIQSDMTMTVHTGSVRNVGGTRSTPTWLPLATVAGAALFNLSWLTLGFISPGFTIWGTTIAPYSPISAGISGLGLGVTAPYMNAAFVISGVLVILGAIGVFSNIPGLSGRQRWLGFVLTGVLAGVGLIIDGTFTLEHIVPHLAGFLIAIGGLVAGFLMVGLALRLVPGWRQLATSLIAGSPAALGLLILYFITFSPTADGARTGVSGLVERLLCLELFTLLAALGWKVFSWRRATANSATLP